MVACGGSSKHESPGSGDDGGASGASAGTSGKGGGAKGGSGGTTSSGASGGTTSGASGGGSGGTGSGATSGTGAGGSVAGQPGGGSDFGGRPGAGGPGEICNEDGCFYTDPSATPLEPSGPIHCGGQECAAGDACCMTTGACFDPEANAQACPRPPDDDDPEGRRPCSSNAHCDALFFCMLEYGELCSAVGHCQPIGNCGGCSGGGDGPNICRLCGCDGNTYPNVQTACRAGAAMAYMGAECGETVQVGGGGGSAGAGGSSSSPPHWVTPCGTNDDCTIDGEVCCGITQRCYPKSDAGQCAQPPEGTRFPCTSNAQCQAYEMCVGEGCGTPGGCVPLESGQCGVILDPVCGCDGVTYTSADCATQSGARVKAEGECPKD